VTVVVLVVLVVELVAAVLLVLAARRTRARLHELEQAQSALEAELAGIPVAAPGNPLLSIEILNAAEVAARQSWAARTFGALVPRMIVREVASRAAEQMSRQLTAQGVEAEVRVIAPALPASEAARP
jgi:HAMP domain-containing protein